MRYKWASTVLFNAWHNAACVHLGLPKASTNASDGSMDEEAQWTTGYTRPFIVNAVDVRAFIEDAVATSVPVGLGLPCAAPTMPYTD